jgi:acyl-CoA hydrolase
MPINLDQASFVSLLRSGSLVFVQGCSGESLLLADHVRKAGAALGPKTFTGIFVPGLNRYDYLANPDCRVLTYFMTPELKKAGAAVDFRPLCYADILTDLRARPIDAALVMLSPPNENGLCSFGPIVDFLPDLWANIPTLIGHINPLLPPTHGAPGIPFSRLSAYIFAEQPLLGQSEEPADDEALAIADFIAPITPNGATLQVGLGKIPGAVLRSLTTRKNLRIHSGLVSDAALALKQAGALAPGIAVTGGVAIGGPALYAACSDPAFEFRPVSHTHSARVLAEIRDFISINSAIEVDLFGQAYAECGPRGWMSGPGGASDFARGAKVGGGLRIVALPSTARAGATSRIVDPRDAFGPVSLGRMDIDMVVTENGLADLRGLDHESRARRLIDIAAEPHRPALIAAWRELSEKLNKGGGK